MTINNEVQQAAEAIEAAQKLLIEALYKIYPKHRGPLSPEARNVFEAVRQLKFENELVIAIANLPKFKKVLQEWAKTVSWDQLSMNSLRQAASKSNWIPPEYGANDWLSDCRFFLEHGHPKATAEMLPIDMVLFCPNCQEPHIDAPDPLDPYPITYEKYANRWTNPPHRSHLCHACGYIWRPADVFTNGVAAIKTKGKADWPIISNEG